jgi:alpha-beta hydrolase superfamily lysophospholipase
MNDTPKKPKPCRRLLKAIIRKSLYYLFIVFSVFVTLILVQAFSSRKMSDIEKWHHAPLKAEFVAKDLTPDYDLEQYLQMEDDLFDELSGYMLDSDSLGSHSQLLRFVRGGSQDPARQPRNWNRTVELSPDVPEGGILLIHGLSDSPYSLRSLAEFFYAQNYYVLVMRMPGHGTVPAGLLDVRWQDWAAAVKVGARHVQSRIDASKPFYMGGYSNGGALAVHHTLVTLKEGGRVPDHLFLFSPAIGITPFGRVARWDMLYGFIPYFEQSKWLGIEVEYDPYKYNSFTKNAGSQSWSLAKEIQSNLDDLESSGELSEMPPMLAFQSVVDATVEAKVLITGLFDRLKSKGNEVVFFDINRSSMLGGFMSLEFADQLDGLMRQTDLSYTVTKLTNRNPQTQLMCARSRLPGVKKISEEQLDLRWPDKVFSLAHVAVPFPPDDPIYGEKPPVPPVFDLHVGSLNPIGEKHVLKIPPSELIRIRHNPFHSYMLQRITQVITP